MSNERPLKEKSDDELTSLLWDEINMLKEENGELQEKLRERCTEIINIRVERNALRERMRGIDEVYEKWNKPENYEKLTEDLQVHYDELMGLATDCWQAIRSAVDGK
jgi:regulator of replication initiation timing